MWGYIAASVAGSLLGNAMTNKANLRNTRENNAHQLRMSNTSHQREVKDLRAAGLNPILSSRSAGAPQPASVAAKVEPYKVDIGQARVQAEQIKLLEAQSQKTRAEAVNTELMEPYNRALANVYGSVLGEPAVGMKTLGAAGSAFGVYQGGKALHRMLKRRKSKVLPESKSVSRKFKRSRGGSNSRSAIRRKDGLKFHEKVDRSTGEIKPRFNRSEALRKASKRTKSGLRRFGGRRRIRF